MSGASETDACVPEWVLSVYVDQELEPDELPAVERHLVDCRACRQLVVELQGEAISLRSALELEESVPSAAKAAHGTDSLAVSSGATLAGALVGVTALGWLLTVPIPAAIAWLNPFDLGGLFAMFFDAVSLSREEAPALYQLAVASAALFSVAFLLTSTFSLATRRLIRQRSTLVLLGALGFSLAAPQASQAIELLIDDAPLRVAEGDVVEETWVTTSKAVDIDGTLRGDLIAVGDRVSISGVLDGNLISAARRVEIEGRVTGSVISVGERVRVAGMVEGNVYTGAGQMTLAETARIGRDLTAGGEGLTISGHIGRDLLAHVEWLELRGAIGRNGLVVVEQGDVLATAQVAGDLELMHRDDVSGVVIDDAAEIGGEVIVGPSKVRSHSWFHHLTTVDFYIFLVLSLVAAFLFGMLMFWLAPWVFGSSFRNGADLLRPLGYGFAIVFAGPIALLLIALTIVGLPVAVAGLAGWLICLYMADIVVAAVIGFAILGVPEDMQWREFALPLLLGLAIVVVATAIPLVGGVFAFLTLLVGSGAFALRIRDRYGA